MEKLTIYQKPTCTTCRKLKNELEERGVRFENVDYFLTPLPEKKILELIRKSGDAPEIFLRKKEPKYKELNLDKKTLDAATVAALLVKHPELMERPIAERGAKAVVARPIERVRELF